MAALLLTLVALAAVIMLAPSAGSAPVSALGGGDAQVSVRNLGETGSTRWCSARVDWRCAQGFTTGGAANGYTLTSVTASFLDKAGSRLRGGYPARRRYQDLSYPSQRRYPAQWFTAGSHSGGYTLSSFAIVFGNSVGSPGNVRVTLHAPDTGNTANPAATAAATLSGPAAPASGTQTYTCSVTGCQLTAGGTYFIVVDAPNAPTGGANYYSIGFAEMVNSATLTPSGNGWAFMSEGREYRVNSWQAVNLRMRLTVTAVPK